MIYCTRCIFFDVFKEAGFVPWFSGWFWPPANRGTYCEKTNVFSFRIIGTSVFLYTIWIERGEFPRLSIYMDVWADFQWFSLHKEKDFSSFPLALANFLKYWGIGSNQGRGLMLAQMMVACLYRYKNIYITLIRLKVLDGWRALINTSPANLSHALKTMRWQSLRRRWSWVLLERRGVLHRWTWWVMDEEPTLSLPNPSNKGFKKNVVGWC